MLTELSLCSTPASLGAEALEETVWDMVQGLLYDPHRLQRAYTKEIERRRKCLRGDPEQETRRLARRLAELDEERRGCLRLAARGSMTDDELDDALAEVDDQRREVEEALRQAQNRQQGIEQLKRDMFLVFATFDQIRSGTLDWPKPEARRKLYRALRLEAHVDEQKRVSIHGVFDLSEIAVLDTLGRPDVVTSDTYPLRG